MSLRAILTGATRLKAPQMKNYDSRREAIAVAVLGVALFALSVYALKHELSASRQSLWIVGGAMVGMMLAPGIALTAIEHYSRRYQAPNRISPQMRESAIDKMRQESFEVIRERLYKDPAGQIQSMVKNRMITSVQGQQFANLINQYDAGHRDGIEDKWDAIRSEFTFLQLPDVKTSDKGVVRATVEEDAL